MSSQQIINATEFNGNDVRFSSLKINKVGGKVINVMDKSSGKYLNLQTPLMFTWGAAEVMQKEKEGETKKGTGVYEMTLQFQQAGSVGTEDEELFLANLKNFENHFKQHVLTNSESLLGKAHKSMEVIEALYNEMIKYPNIPGTTNKDYSRAPTIRIKIPCYNGVWSCLLCDDNGRKIFPNPSKPNITPLDIIKRASNVITIIQCNGIYIINGKFGVTWKLIQAVVQSPKPTLYEECYIKIKPADKEKLKVEKAVDIDEDIGEIDDDAENVAITIVDTTSVEAKPDNFVEDSDDEEDKEVENTKVTADDEEVDEETQETETLKEEEIQVPVTVAVEETSTKKKVNRRKPKE